MQTSPESSGGMRDELRSDAHQLSTTASNRLHEQVDARKGDVAKQARSVSSAIDKAAGELDDSSPDWLKSAFRQGAQQVQRLADSFEQKDSRAIMADVQSMARNNPGAFLAGCAALGFAAARLLKAGSAEASAGSARQPQFPPAQVDEPMFRPSESSGTRSTPATGEFA